MKVGDKVVVARKFDADTHPYWVHEMDATLGKVGTVTRCYEDNSVRVKFDTLEYSYLKSSLDPFERPKLILSTEKLMCGNAKCRKILAIKEVESGYVTVDGPWFKVINLCSGMGIHSVDSDGKPIWRDCGSGEKTIAFGRFEKEFDVGVPALCIRENCIYLESVFQDIVVWLTKAADNMDIEKNNWSGIEEVVI